jgi:hypothetical protein
MACAATARNAEDHAFLIAPARSVVREAESARLLEVCCRLRRGPESSSASRRASRRASHRVKRPPHRLATVTPASRRASHRVKRPPHRLATVTPTSRRASRRVKRPPAPRQIYGTRDTRETRDSESGFVEENPQVGGERVRCGIDRQHGAYGTAFVDQKNRSRVLYSGRCGW